jgi:DNA-binding transcriptional MocR family regulator
MSSNTDRYSAVYKRLKLGAIKALYKYYTPDSINLAGGIPMNSCFPIKQVKVTLDNDNSKEEGEFDLIKGSNLFLNYHRGTGLDCLMDWIKNHIKKVHNPIYDFGYCSTVGNSDSLAKIVTLLNGDIIFFDEYSYANAITTCETFGFKAVGVMCDAYGVLPEHLKQSVLQARLLGKKADIIYLVPTGHNPCGYTIPFWRKIEIYDVCKELDVIIIEDGNNF